MKLIATKAVTDEIEKRYSYLDEESLKETIKPGNDFSKNILTEGTHYDELASKMIADSGLFPLETSKKIINALFREDIHAFNHSPAWLEKYLKGIARMLIKEANGDTNRAASFLEECPAVFDEYLTWIKENRNEKNKNKLDDNFINSMSYKDVKDFLDKVQDERDKESRDELSKMTFDKTNFSLVPIDSFEQMHKMFGGRATGDGSSDKYAGGGGTAWCHANSKKVYDGWIDGGNKFFVLQNNDWKNIPFNKESNKKNPKDAYGNSLIAILVNKYGRLKRATLRCNHVGVFSNADNQYKTYAELSQIAGFNVEEEVLKHLGIDKSQLALPTIETGVVIDCSEGATDVVVPSTYNGSPVTSIGGGAFTGCDSLISVKIPNSITSIGKRAFAYCNSLTSINIPNSVTSIGEEAFLNCDSLTSITIPNSVTIIGEGVFTGCGSLTSVDLPNNLITIDDEVFADCASLTSINIPNQVTSIGNRAFYDCQSLASVNIPSSVTNIGDNSFSYCSSLTSVIIPKSVTSIGDDSFFGCYDLIIKTNNKYVMDYCKKNKIPVRKLNENMNIIDEEVEYDDFGHIIGNPPAHEYEDVEEYKGVKIKKWVSGGDPEPNVNDPKVYFTAYMNDKIFGNAFDSVNAAKRAIDSYEREKRYAFMEGKKIDESVKSIYGSDENLLRLEIDNGDIYNAALISIEEAENLPRDVRKYHNRWWLRSSGDGPDLAAYVNSDGSVSYIGHVVNDDFYVVRPTLTVRGLKSKNLELYSEVSINGKKFIVIGKDTVLYDDEPVHYYFNKTLDQGNDYSMSDVRRFVENDFIDMILRPKTPQKEAMKIDEDTIKQGNAWVNKGKEGTHGKFRTKKEADAQRKAMFAQGYKGEELKESDNEYVQIADTSDLNYRKPFTKFKIVYDCDEKKNSSTDFIKNKQEIFNGNFDKLQDRIKELKKQGYYNIRTYTISQDSEVDEALNESDLPAKIFDVMVTYKPKDWYYTYTESFFVEASSEQEAIKQVTPHTPDAKVEAVEIHPNETKINFMKRRGRYIPASTNESLNESAYEDFMNEIRQTDEYHKISKILERAYKVLSNEEYKKVYAEAQKVKKEIMASHEGLKESRQNNEYYRGEVIWNYAGEDAFEVGFKGKPREFTSKEEAKKAIDKYRKEPHYLSKYERDYYSGPEEGSCTSTGLFLIDSKRYPDYDSAVRALEVKQADYTEDELEYVGNDIFEDSYGYVYLVEHDKGSEHSPAKSWTEAELGEGLKMVDYKEANDMIKATVLDALKFLKAEKQMKKIWGMTFDDAIEEVEMGMGNGFEDADSLIDHLKKYEAKDYDERDRILHNLNAAARDYLRAYNYEDDVKNFTESLNEQRVETTEEMIERNLRNTLGEGSFENLGDGDFKFKDYDSFRAGEEIICSAVGDEYYKDNDDLIITVTTDFTEDLHLKKWMSDEERAEMKKFFDAELANAYDVSDLARDLKVSGPSYRGARMPESEKQFINEKDIPDNMRYKSYRFDYDILDHDLFVEWLTQEPFNAEDAEKFKAEVLRAIKFHADKHNLNDINVYFRVKCRDGAEYGSLNDVETVNKTWSF